MHNDIAAIYIKSIAHYRVYRTRNPTFARQFIIWNTNYSFHEAHAHIISEDGTPGICETIIQNILNKRKPKRHRSWVEFHEFIIDHIRISDDLEYSNILINLINDDRARSEAFKHIDNKRAS